MDWNIDDLMIKQPYFLWGINSFLKREIVYCKKIHLPICFYLEILPFGCDPLLLNLLIDSMPS